MAGKRSRHTDYLVYVLVRVAICLLQVVSWNMALAFARFLAWLAYRIDRRHRAVADENLRHAFPDLDAGQRDQLVRGTYHHFCTVMVEMIRLPRVLNRRNYRTFTHWVPADGEQIGIRWAKCGRPLLILTGHFGNWEILGYTIGLVGLSAGIIARKIDNPYIDRMLKQLRTRTGQELLDKNEDYGKILEYLGSGRHRGMVGDQDAGARGLYVDFLGRPASTFKSIALLSLEYQAPILVIGAARVGSPMKYRLYFEDVILPEDFSNDPDAARAITQRYTAALERMIRRHPEQYFWLHRRWKHQPKQRTRKAA
ncbi:MAG: lysophospholipid acyltransferase family protein [Gemmataceae bacterium]